MMRSRIAASNLLFGLLVTACGQGGESSRSTLALRVNTADDLAFALETASSGDEIALSPGIYLGQFSVPAGVHLNGGGATLRGEGPAVLTVAGGTLDATIIENLTIQNRGPAVLAVNGAISIDDVSIEVATGAGLVAEGVADLRLARTRIAGPVTAEGLADIGEEIDPSQTAAIGVAISNTRVDISQLAVSGFAGFGAVFRGTTGRWQNGSVRSYVGTGVLVEGGDIALDQVEVSEGLRGRRIGNIGIAIGVVVSADGLLTTTSTSIHDIEGPGLLQDNAFSSHAALSVENADMAGIWVQNVLREEAALTLTGATSLAHNRGTGLYFRAVRGVTLEGVLVSETIKRPSAAGTVRFDVGDGFQGSGLAGRVVLRNTTLENNQRIGLLIDGEDASVTPEFEIDELSIGGASGDYGLHIQRADVNFRSEVSIDGPLDERDLAADDGRILDTLPPLTRFPRIGNVSELASVLIGNDGQLIPWTIDGNGLRP